MGGAEGGRERRGGGVVKRVRERPVRRRRDSRGWDRLLVE